MELRLGGSGANGTDAQEIGDVLRGDGVQHLACQRHTKRCEFGEKLSSYLQALVDVEAIVHVGVVDQPLPAYSRTWLFKIGSHYNHKLVLVLLSKMEKSSRIINSLFGIMYRTGANHDQKAISIIFVRNEVCNFLT